LAARKPVHGVVRRMPPAAGTTSAAQRQDLRHDLAAAGRSASPRPRADEGLQDTPEQSPDGLFHVPPLTAFTFSVRLTLRGRDLKTGIVMSCPNKPTASLTERLESARGQEYWRCLEELADTPEFRARLEREFPQAASVWDGSVSRRRFLALMGASLALAGVTGCAQ